jgi:hypothetical protein
MKFKADHYLDSQTRPPSRCALQGVREARAILGEKG